MSELFEELARPVVAVTNAATSMEASYREMSSDADREREADERTESLIQDSLLGEHAGGSTSTHPSAAK